MLVRQAFRYELAPTAVQRAALANHAGAARWAWNWGLAVRSKAYHRRGETLTAVDLHRLLNRLKRTPRFAWLYEVSKCAPQEALRDLDRAYANYWRGRRRSRRVGLPRFKKRGRCRERFRLTGAIRVEEGVVVLPRIGQVATKEPTGKFRGRILSAPRSTVPGHWSVACGSSDGVLGRSAASSAGRGTAPRRRWPWRAAIAASATSEPTRCTRPPRHWRKPSR
jgi:putative transposase